MILLKEIPPAYEYIKSYGYSYIRVNKDGSIYRENNPMFYRKDEINNENFKII